MLVPNLANLAPALAQKFTNDGLVSGQPFPNNTIPADLLDPNAQALLTAGGPFGGIFPAPTTNDVFALGVKAPTSVKEEIARLDETYPIKPPALPKLLCISASLGAAMTIEFTDIEISDLP